MKGTGNGQRERRRRNKDVRSGEERDELSLGEEFISILDDLMCSTNEIHVVFLQETRNDVGTESKRNSTIVLGPSSDFLIGIRPQKIAKQSYDAPGSAGCLNKLGNEN